MSAKTALLSMAGGIAYLIGYLGLSHAFVAGPVELVAPIVGAYSVLSVTWAEPSGAGVVRGDWIAVIGIVVGVGLVAILNDPDDNPKSQRAAALWVALSASEFSAAFAFGQSAAAAGGEWSVILLMRLTAILLELALAVGSGIGTSVNHLAVLS